MDSSATSGSSNGTSWCDAFLELQDALAVAIAADTIRVANGTYRPDQGAGQVAGDRTATFRLITGVAIEGGYAGCSAPDPDERDIALHETTLSGDLNQDDLVNFPGFSNFGDNSAHVLIADGVGSSAILDGFTITGGNADVVGDFHGGGLFVTAGASPTLGNCLFIHNLGVDNGGGIYSDFASAGTTTVTGSTFIENLAGAGGAISVGTSGTVAMDGCTFIRNQGTGGSGGGAIRAHDANLRIKSCAFVNNVGQGIGGGGYTARRAPGLQ